MPRPDPLPSRRRAHTLAVLAALLPLACSAPPSFVTELDAAAACLDSLRFDEAAVRLDVALTAARSNDDRAQVLAMQLEAQLARKDLEQAAFAVERLRLIAPAAFVTWKAQAVLDLRLEGSVAARKALQAAKGRMRAEGQTSWVRDFEKLLDALDAFRDGDLVATRQRLDGITHSDVLPSAAWLGARLDAIESVQTQRISAARRDGAREGLLDLWHAAIREPALQDAIATRARQIGVPLPPSPAGPDELVERGLRTPSPLAVASVAAVARLAVEQTPLRTRAL